MTTEKFIDNASKIDAPVLAEEIDDQLQRKVAMPLIFNPVPEAIRISEAKVQHHIKWTGRTGGFKDADGAPRIPTPEEVVELGWEPKSYLDQFKAD